MSENCLQIPVPAQDLRERVCIFKMAEQQAFAGRGLDYVMDAYLPERLGEMGII